MASSVPTVPQERWWIARYLIHCAHAHKRGDITPWQMFASLMLLKWLRWHLAWVRLKVEFHRGLRGE
jgi:hypothetical protein